MAAKAAQAAEAAPSSARRELPADPAAREAALSEVRPVAQTILAIVDVAASRLPPQRPLSNEEKAAISTPLEMTLWKYGAELEPEWQLALAIAAVGFGRYVEVKAKAQGIDLSALTGAAQPKATAATATVEVPHA